MNVFTSLTILSSSDIVLSAKHWKPRNNENVLPFIIFIHQYAKMGGCGLLMEGMAKQATSKGYNAITFDLRGSGSSSGTCTFTNYEELNDVKAVVDYVQNNYSNDILVIGSSAGAPLAGAILDYSDRIKGGILIGYGKSV